jgi:hypothetical protein
MGQDRLSSLMERGEQLIIEDTMAFLKDRLHSLPIPQQAPFIHPLFQEELGRAGFMPPVLRHPDFSLHCLDAPRFPAAHAPPR